MNEQLTKQVQKALEEALKGVEGSLEEKLEQSAKLTVKQLKATSPRGSGKRHYANGWSYELESSWKGIELVIYNKTKPQLTHILNNGFTMRNGQRHSGDGHIDEAEEVAIRDVERGLKEL